MAVDADDIDLIAARTAALYREAENALLATVRDHLARGMDAPTWAQNRLAAVGALRRAAQSIVSGLTADGSAEIRAAVASGYRTGRGSALTDLPEGWYPHSGIGADARRATAVVSRVDAMESLAGALIRDVGDRTANVLRHIEDVYRQTITGAVARSVAGGLTRRQASQQAWQRFVDEGVTSFTDVRGRRWRLSTYTEMAVRTVTQRAAVQGQTDRLASLGLDLGLVSDSPRECPRCRPWEGKVLSLSGGQTGRVQVPSAVSAGMVTVDVAGTLDEARAAGFQHPNCTHSVRAYLPGATRRPTRPTANPDGYKAKDRQRAIERQIRRWKEQEAAALDSAAATAARARVRGWQATMRDHLDAHPELKRQSHREQIGAGSAPRGGRVAPAGRLPGAPRQLTVDGRSERLPAARPHDVDAPPVDDQAPLPGQIEIDFSVRDPLDGIDLNAINDDELFDLFERAVSAEQVDDDLLARLSAEMDRRESQPAAADPADAWLSGPKDERLDWPDPDDLTPEQQRLDELLEQGHDFQSAYAEAYGVSEAALARDQAASLLDRRAGETLDQAARRAYDEWVNLEYLRAEEECSGYLLNREGVAAGIDPRELWSGNLARTRKYASEELLRWWSDNARLNFTQFRADLLQREQDIRAAERTRLSSNDQDFI